MQLRKDQNDNEPITLQKEEEQWELIEKAWGHIPIKYYEVNIECGKASHKRLLYVNRGNTNISYLVQCNRPNIIKIKNTAIILSKDEGTYIKFIIDPPNTPCKFDSKFVFYDVKQGIPIEGIEMEIVAKKK